MIELEVLESPIIEMDMDVAVNISGNVDVVPLYADENKTYEEQGKAYSPVEVNVPNPPMWWIGDEWEKMPDCWDETVSLKNVGFDNWPASNTAGTLRASGAANPFTADMANYDYLIMWRFYWTAAYNEGATLLAIPIIGATIAYQFMTRRPQTLADVRGEDYRQNTYALLYTVLYQEYYNTSGSPAANWGNAYGITITPTAPTYSGGDTIVITPNYPSIGARCNNSYFGTARKNDIDSENSTIRLVGEVYRVKRSALRQNYETMVDVANHGI